MKKLFIFAAIFLAGFCVSKFLFPTSTAANNANAANQAEAIGATRAATEAAVPQAVTTPDPIGGGSDVVDEPTSSTPTDVKPEAKSAPVQQDMKPKLPKAKVARTSATITEYEAGPVTIVKPEGYTVKTTPTCGGSGCTYVVEIYSAAGSLAHRVMNSSPYANVLPDNCVLLPYTRDFNFVGGLSHVESVAYPMVLCREGDTYKDATGEHVDAVSSLMGEKWCQHDETVQGEVRRAISSAYFGTQGCHVEVPLVSCMSEVYTKKKDRLANHVAPTQPAYAY
jgi:hypothetical protein